MSRIVWGVILFVLAGDALMQVLAGGAGDKEWLLLAARMVMAGKTLYVDIFEVDPPLIVWLYSAPVWLSQHVPLLTDTQWLGFLGVSAVALVVSLGVGLLRLHPAFEGHRARQRVFALLLAAMLMFFTTQIYFFDRDHIFFVLVFPYLLRCMPSLAAAALSRRFRGVIAVLAVVGFCIKPYTVIVFAAVQLLQWWRVRSFKVLWNMENAIIVTGACVYIACAWYFTPDYFTTMLPMAWATYSGFNRRINALLFLAVAFVSAGLTFADFRFRHATPYRCDLYYFIGLCVAFCVYALAGNGWGYTYNPLLCMLLFVSGWALWEYRWLKNKAQQQGLPVQLFVSGIRATTLNLTLNSAYMLLCIGTFFLGSPCGDKRCPPDPYVQYVQEHHVRSFATFTMDLRRWTSFARQTRTEWGTRFNCLFMLPKLLLADDEWRSKHRWITEYVARAYAQDLTQGKPDVVFVDRSDGIFNYPHPVDIPGFFNRVPEFREVWSHYRYVTTIDQCDKPDPRNPRQISIDCRFDLYRPVSAAVPIEGPQNTR